MKKITIIGCGTIGKIFLHACKNIFPDSQIKATVKSCESVEKLGLDFSSVNFSSDNKLATENSELIILAVKPQDFLEVAGQIKELLQQNVLVISAMAGISFAKIKKELGIEKIVRTMPNLGARVGKSMTVWTCSNEVDENDKKNIIDLLNSIGKELFVKTEEKVDKATAVSGSGPGFFFVVIEEWLKAVEEFGFSEEEAKLLLLQTIDGANVLLQQGGNVSELRRQVASKGGTTEAGLRVLEEAGLSHIWTQTLEKAFEKVQELSNT